MKGDSFVPGGKALSDKAAHQIQAGEEPTLVPRHS
jgi:hypothetical protein